MDKKPEPDFLALGLIARPHGVSGEVRVDVLTDFGDRWEGLKTVYIGPHYEPYHIQSTRHHQKAILIKFEGYNTRDSVDSLRGEFIYIPTQQAMPLEPDEFYFYQVIGLDVRTEDGESYGEIVDVLRPPNANEVFVVYGNRGEILIPVIEDVINLIDIDAGYVVITPLPGLLPDT